MVMVADLMRALPLPKTAEVSVLGDTAYDAEVLREACGDRGYDWIFPCHPERVLSGTKPRPRVRSLWKDWSSWSVPTIRFNPGQDPDVNYRRPLGQPTVGLEYLAERLTTPGDIAKLKRLIRNSIAPEFRAAL